MEKKTNQPAKQKDRIFYCVAISVAFVALLWLVKFIEVQENLSFAEYGVFPRRLSGLVGIILAPLIHSDFNHLISNSLTLIVLLTGVLYFYKDLAYRVILYIWIVGGIAVWVGARESYHIGASGLIYGIASFLFFSGIIRKNTRLMAVSLLVVFLYGSMVWGIFPIYPKISWEYHLYSVLCGYLCADIYKKKGPQRIVYDWELEPDEPDEEEPDEKEDKSTNSDKPTKEELDDILKDLTHIESNTSSTSNY